MSVARRILAFAGAPFLSLVAPFVFLPVLARIAGAESWTAVAIGQSVGGFAALVAALGYNTLGPTKVARVGGDTAARRRILAASLHARLPVWIIAALVAVVVAALVAPAGHGWEAGLMAFAMSLTGLSLSWYFVGIGRALPLLWYDVLPRLVATILAAVLLVLGGSVLWYPTLLTLAIAGGTAWCAIRFGGRALAAIEPGEVAAVFREHPPAVIAESSAGAYNALAVTLVGIVTPVAQAAAYVSGDKAYRIGQYASSSAGNALQGWVVEHGPAEFPARYRRAFLIHLGIGVVGLLGFALLGPLVTGWLFGETVRIDEPTAVAFGVASLAISIGTATGRIGLISHGARRAFMVCVLIASAVGVASILVLGHLLGAAGGAWGVATGEVVSVLLQGSALLRVRRTPVRESSV